MLPQKDPAFYDSLPRTYNLPELIAEPVRVGPVQITRGVFKSAQPVASDGVTQATPAAAAPR